MSRRGGAERGFTLVEALVSLAILGMAVVTALEVTARTLGTQASAERHLEAVALADAKLNELALLPSDSLALYADVRSGEVELESRDYRWRAIVRRDANDAALWAAAVRIEWSGGAFDLETVLYRRPGVRERLRGEGS